MRILVVEDDLKSAAYVKKGLSETAFVVDVARDGESALNLAGTTRYDLIILDIMLPGKDGWAVLEALRGRVFPQQDQHALA